MEIITKKEERAYAIKVTVEEDKKQIGRVYLYVIYNDLHKEPYGLMEDLFVEEEARGKGVGRQLIEKVLEQARELGLTKLIAQSRFEKEHVHEMYEKIGFKKHGYNFRMDFS